MYKTYIFDLMSENKNNNNIYVLWTCVARGQKYERYNLIFGSCLSGPHQFCLQHCIQCKLPTYTYMQHGAATVSPTVQVAYSRTVILPTAKLTVWSFAVAELPL